MQKLIDTIPRVARLDVPGQGTWYCKREWQDTGYILSLFGKGRAGKCKNNYLEFVKEGIAQERCF